MDGNYKSDLQTIGLIEVMQVKLMTLTDLIRSRIARLARFVSKNGSVQQCTG